MLETMNWQKALRTYAPDLFGTRGIVDTNLRKKLCRQLGWPVDKLSLTKSDAQKVARAAREIVVEMTDLDDKQKTRVQRVIDEERRILYDQFETKVELECERRMPDLVAERKAKLLELAEKTRQQSVLVSGWKKMITQDEYRFLLQCVHPDRATPEQQEKFTKAFNIISKLKEYAEIG